VIAVKTFYTALMKTPMEREVMQLSELLARYLNGFNENQFVMRALGLGNLTLLLGAFSITF